MVWTWGAYSGGGYLIALIVERRLYDDRVARNALRILGGQSGMNLANFNSLSPFRELPLLIKAPLKILYVFCLSHRHLHHEIRFLVEN